MGRSARGNDSRACGHAGAQRVAGLVGSPEEETSRPNLRLRVVGIAVLVLFAVLVVRLWTLQVIDAKTYAAQVTRNQVRVVAVSPSRGQIVDRNNTVLAGGQPQEEILLSRVSAAQNPTVVAKVAALIGRTPQQVQTTVNNDQYGPYEPIPLATGIPAATVQYLQVHQSDYPGVSVEPVTTRTYPQGGNTAAHVLGYLGDITSTFLNAHKNAGYAHGSQVGISGIEAQYETYLRGVNGRQALEVDASGNVVGTVSSTAPQTGDTVVLNIDTGLQQAVEADLANQIMSDRQTPDKLNGNIYPPAKDGAVIVMNPQNGQILAMASYPSYDLNEWVGGISAANYTALQASGAENNNAIQGLFIPGSTFKLITATADLQDGVYDPNQYFSDTGSYTVPGCTGGAGAGCTFHDDQDSGAGDVNLPQALVGLERRLLLSTGRPLLAGPGQVRRRRHPERRGPNTARVTSPGSTCPTRCRAASTACSVEQKLHAQDPKGFPNTPTWNTGDNIEMAFGQGGTVVTPIEQAVAYATFANGGTRYQPQVASAIVDPVTGKVVQAVHPGRHRARQPAAFDLPAHLAGARRRDHQRDGQRRLHGLPLHLRAGRQDGNGHHAGSVGCCRRADQLVRGLRAPAHAHLSRAGRHRSGRVRGRCGGAAGAETSSTTC